MMKKNTNIKAQFSSSLRKYSHVCPDPKLLKVNEPYAFSFNPASQPYEYQSNETIKGDIQIWTNCIISLLKSLRFCKVNIRPEISSNGRVHFHGTIHLLNIARFMLFDIPLIKDKGTFEIDTIKDPETWKTYYTKGEFYMLDYCKEEKIPYILTNDTKLVKVENKLQDIKYEWVDLPEKDINGESVGAERKKVNRRTTLDTDESSSDSE